MTDRNFYLMQIVSETCRQGDYDLVENVLSARNYWNGIDLIDNSRKKDVTLNGRWLVVYNSADIRFCMETYKMDIKPQHVFATPTATDAFLFRL